MSESTNQVNGASIAGSAKDESTSQFDSPLWAYVQPVLVIGTLILVAFMVSRGWVYSELFAAIMLIIPVPLCIVAERVWTKRTDWLLEPKEMAEDAFWLAFAGILWVPLYSNFYETPLSAGFKALRDLAPLQISLEPSTIPGILGSAFLILLVSSFIYYWLHRIQHESLFWWRMHATHHHITKMGCMRGDRTHPLEYMTLMLGTPVALALLGASDSVMAVVGAFGIWNGVLNHSNLPIKTLPIYDLIFATAPQHHAHHAFERRQADSNYGCMIILWDRVFGTYCGDAEVGKIGAGKAVPLSIKNQLALSFYSDERLKSL